MKGDTGIGLLVRSGYSAWHALSSAQTNWQAYACITACSLVRGTGRLPSRGLLLYDTRR